MMAWESVPDETPFDPSEIIPSLRGVVTTRSELNVYEAENIRKAAAKYLAGRPTPRIAPFTLTWLRALHGEMFCDVLRHAGKFRQKDLNLGIPWAQIETSLENMLADMQVWGGDFFERSARLHYQAVHIHPFENGNGRWARLLANIWLALQGHPVTDWPAEVIETKSIIREEYIAAIKAGDEGHEAPLIELHRRYTVA
jgi:Fic-DOC domain mobile mystery protein B